MQQKINWKQYRIDDVDALKRVRTAVEDYERKHNRLPDVIGVPPGCLSEEVEKALTARCQVLHVVPRWAVREVWLGVTQAAG